MNRYTYIMYLSEVKVVIQKAKRSVPVSINVKMRHSSYPKDDQLVKLFSSSFQPDLYSQTYSSELISRGRVREEVRVKVREPDE